VPLAMSFIVDLSIRPDFPGSEIICRFTSSDMRFREIAGGIEFFYGSANMSDACWYHSGRPDPAVRQ
jgi:hypothetical protein